MAAHIETIFTAARGLRGDARDAYLDDACAGDTGLRSRVEALLQADADAGSFLVSAVREGGVGPSRAAKTEGRGVPIEDAGRRIGKYRLLQNIGEGGFGTVWMAEQREPVRRKVALKIIKLGMDTRQIVARFEAERQALALLEHPNIARVFDAGSTESGRPYFVMELVRGAPILEFCDARRLDTRARLDLFVLVCNAIQHAHQKGIIHRDIKPGNILVTLHDGVPVPKVIDFGIAKATNQELTQRTLFTEHHQLVGTPAYMSPEQAEMSGLDIDTRSDIYSLGVLLYELLTGTTPFAHQELMERGFGEMLRIIREETPQKPSTRLSTLGKIGIITAEKRHADVKKLGFILRGDLDWIVMKCLEKDRGRRYDTASGLATDIARHLGDEPVTAGPPGAGYKLGKFVKRHRGRVAAAGAIAALLVLGVIGTSSGMVWAMSERDNARAAELETAQRADELQQVADFQAQQLGEIDPEMMGVILRRALLAAATDDRRAQVEASVSGINFTGIALQTLEDGVFERTVDAIDLQFDGQPLVQAQMLQSLSDTLRELGLYEAAADPQARALEIRLGVAGEEAPSVLDSLGSAGALSQAQGDLPEAEAQLRRALEGSRRVLGDDHPATLTAVSNLGVLLQARGELGEAESLSRQALDGRRRVLGDDHPSTLLSLNCTGSVLQDRGRLDEAEACYLASLEGRRRVLGDDDPKTLNSMNNMGSLLRMRGRPGEATRYYREAIEGYRRVLGDAHPKTLNSINGLGVLLESQGEFAGAELCFREALEGRRRVFGDDNPETLNSMSNMGSVLREQGRLEEAESVYRKVIEGRRRVLGDDHSGTLVTMNNLGALLRLRGDLEQAELYLREVLEKRRRLLGNDHPSTQISVNNMGSLLQDQGRLAEAEPYYIEALEGRRRRYGDHHHRTVVSVNNYASLLNQLSRFDDAVELLGAGDAAARAVWGGRPGLLGLFISKLGIAQHGLGMYQDSEAAFLEAHRLHVEEDGPDSAAAQACVARLVDLYSDWHAAERGNGYDAESERWRARLSEPE